MQLREQWIREGFSNYYVVKKECKLTYEKNILRYHTLSCILPCEFRMQDGEEYYYYETGIYTPLKDRINTIDPKLFFAYLLEVFEETESYLLKLDHLKLETELLFMDKEDHPVLCYLPEYEKNIFEQLREFLESCIELIAGNDKKRVRFYYEFHSFLVKEKPNMEQMKEYLEIRPKINLETNQMEKKMSEEISIAIEEDDENLLYKRGKSFSTIKWQIFFGSLLILSICSLIYFLIQIFGYGFYYIFLIGFLASLVSIGFFVYSFYKLWKKSKNENQDVNLYKEAQDNTILLDDKTVLLMEEPIGRLMPKNNQLKEIVLDDNEFIIGSSEEGTDYQLEGTGISRRHIRFYKKENDIYCEDLDSTNGVKVNGKKVKSIILKEGDRIKIGLEEFVFSQK